jgi:hypothetical protein
MVDAPELEDPTTPEDVEVLASGKLYVIIIGAGVEF